MVLHMVLESATQSRQCVLLPGISLSHHGGGLPLAGPAQHQDVVWMGLVSPEWH
jgi:hypothetical protein